MKVPGLDVVFSASSRSEVGIGFKMLREYQRYMEKQGGQG